MDTLNRDTYIDEVVHARFPEMSDEEKLEVMREIWEYFELLLEYVDREERHINTEDVHISTQRLFYDT